MTDKTPLQAILDTPRIEVKERMEAVKAAFPEDDGTTIEDHGWRTVEVVKAYKAAAEAKAQAEGTMERCKLLLMEKMENAGTLKTGSFVITFKAKDRKGYTVEPCRMRSVTVTKTTTTAKAAKATASRTVKVDKPTEVPVPE